MVSIGNVVVSFFVPHPFSRETPKALRSLTIERLVARDGALCIRVTVILHCLQEAFLMEGCLVTRNTVRAHPAPFELARYIIFRIYYRLFVIVQNGQAKIASP